MNETEWLDAGGSMVQVALSLEGKPIVDAEWAQTAMRVLFGEDRPVERVDEPDTADWMMGMTEDEWDELERDGRTEYHAGGYALEAEWSV